MPYWYSQTECGVVFAQITVDGNIASTGPLYLTALHLSEPVPNGATQYIVAAAFVGALARGSHTIEIHSKGTGDALRKPPFHQYFPDGFFEFSTACTVNVH